MAGVLYASARTAPRVRAELQASKESARGLAGRYGLNPKTVAKWRKRGTTEDAPLGPRLPDVGPSAANEGASGLPGDLGPSRRDWRLGQGPWCPEFRYLDQHDEGGQAGDAGDVHQDVEMPGQVVVSLNAAF